MIQVRHDARGNCGPVAVLIGARNWWRGVRRYREGPWAGWPVDEKQRETEQLAVMTLRTAVKVSNSTNEAILATFVPKTDSDQDKADAAGELKRFLEMDMWYPDVQPGAKDCHKVHFSVGDLSIAAEEEKVQIILLLGPSPEEPTDIMKLPEGANERKKVYIFGNTTPTEEDRLRGVVAGWGHVSHWNLLVPRG
jgi:hypothetical protein